LLKTSKEWIREAGNFCNFESFQEEIFDSVTSATTFRTTEEAIKIANDTLYGLGARLWLC
jgi:acyl-CoA reductase-like NAD-dependent aldehyde dehydrogenase